MKNGQLTSSEQFQQTLIRINLGEMSQINLPKSFCMFNLCNAEMNQFSEERLTIQGQSLYLKRQRIKVKVHLSVVKLSCDEDNKQQNKDNATNTEMKDMKVDLKKKPTFLDETQGNQSPIKKIQVS